MIHFLFDGPPGPEGPRFIESETPDGKSINAGEWHERPDGFWELRVDVLWPRLPEGHVKVPESAAEARMMILLANDYLSQAALLGQAGVTL